MREIEFNLDENPFINFLSSRYCMNARINVEKLWNWCHENDKSFFIMSLGCLINAVNKVPELKRRIINDKVYEFEYLDGTCPIMDSEKEIYREMRVEPPENFENIYVWQDYVQQLSQDILSGKKEGFSIDMHLRDKENIANFSCIPWVDFDSITNCIVESNQIQPLITWGQVNKNYEMTVSITVSHIFVNGRELGYFYEHVQKQFSEIPK
ncbi:MAG: chloramphenicol acetyltransferase [Methanobrevibacter sp.]|uniref:CatA-like O-acetyltransferase n=1 Tax=Methanobrevibacter sp. TaxID=66852 RepID=UPI0025FB05BC|nr:CatA-like O-acetyltransferase [Methanobrevibacter sp.]MBQ6100134.1 chloramphenicol acetyltransferase [Methanobrevibacter sp.]